MAEQRIKDVRRPVSIWRSKDLTEKGPASALTVILRTRGCSWRGCSMCGYASEGAPATAEDLVVQFGEALKRREPEDSVVKIYTSGSFLDEKEVPPEAREKILDMIEEAGFSKLIVESRPEYVSSDLLKDCLSRVETEVGIGLETSNDLIRDKIIRKGFTFTDFVRAADTIHGAGGRVKAYLLQKPPMLSEGVAIRDMISSARAARPYADIISLNLCNVQRGTEVERLWERGEYRPPWLWSAVEVLKGIDGPVICDPVGAGTRRGPHNCFECDAVVAQAIRDHDLSQDRSIFEGLHCKCRPAWRKVVELEERSFGAPLA